VIESLDELLTRQANVLARAQAHAHGISDGQIRTHVGAGRWQRVYEGVFATFTGPLPAEASWWAALLYAGSGAVLSHATAAELHDLAARSDNVHVTVPAARKVTRQPGLIVHRSRRLGHDDVHPSLVPPRTRVERTVLDLVDAARTLNDAVAVMADAVQRRRTSPDRLLTALQERSDIRWRRRLLPVLADVATGAHSLLEVRYLRVERRHGLPVGRRQHRIRDGRRLSVVDVDYEEFGVCTELDGRLGHADVRGRWRDMDRDNAAATHGRLVLRYGHRDLVGRGCRVAGQVATVLGQRGWRGTPQRCGRSCEL
jgi:hypothetical protein